MATNTDDKRVLAENFLDDQLSKLSPDQKEKLSYVLFGATMGSSIVGTEKKEGE